LASISASRQHGQTVEAAPRVGQNARAADRPCAVENQLNAIADKRNQSLTRYGTRFAKIDSDFALLKWTIAGIYALSAPSLWLLLRIAAKVGALK
jgi:hypothetical protein